MNTIFKGDNYTIRKKAQQEIRNQHKIKIIQVVITQLDTHIYIYLHIHEAEQLEYL